MSLSTDIIDLLRRSFADVARWPRWPKPLHLIQGALLFESGTDISDAARMVGTTVTRLMEVATGHDPVEIVLRATEADLKAEAIAKLRRNVGQLVLARAAEIAFQEIFEAGIDRREFSMKDVRESRTNTDFRLLNGGGRPLYRFNVKFVGAIFRRGAELVNLLPTDCFLLATYKILAALQEQEREHLPYVFAVVGVPDLNASAVAEAISEQEIRPLAMLFASPVVTRKRDFEDWLVSRIVEARSFAFTTAYERIREAEWYILSARRANDLMHRLLFERVYVLRVPGFTRQFPAAEVDMHFSLSQELVRLRDFLLVVQQDGPGRVTTMLERGTY